MKLDSRSPAPPPHWMLREIDEQPGTLAATLDRYVEGSAFRHVVCRQARDWLKSVQREIVIAASGSSRHAGLAGEIMLEDLAGIPVDVEYSSEYTYRSTHTLLLYDFRLWGKLLARRKRTRSDQTRQASHHFLCQVPGWISAIRLRRLHTLPLVV